MHAGFISHFLFWGKIAGAASAIGSFGYGAFCSLSAAFQTKKLVEILSTNHIPHIEEAIGNHTAVLQGLKSDISSVDAKCDNLGIRQDEIKTAVGGLQTSFIQHLENASQEKPKRKRSK